MSVTDTAKLRQRIKDAGYRLGYVAEVLGISQYTLQKKLDNDSEFKISEVDALAKLLGLTPAEKNELFFAV